MKRSREEQQIHYTLFFVMSIYKVDFEGASRLLFR